jgi:hypothetical protein
MGITPRKCIKQLLYETENAIKQVNINQQGAIRHLEKRTYSKFYQNKT